MKTIQTMMVMLLLLAGGAADVLAQKVGTSSLQFLKVMPTARATAMGDAFVTLASGADALFWNPAGLASAQNHEISTTLTLWLFDTYQSAGAYALPLGDFGTLGFQFQFVNFGSIEETRVDQLQFVGPQGNQRYNPGLTGKTFTPTTYLFGLSYARNLTESFSTGVTIKYVRESLYGSSTYAVTNPATGVQETYNTAAGVLLFDFGILYNTGYRSVRIGASVQNFGGQVQFAQEAYPAPLAFRLGAAADLMGSNALLMPDETHRLTVAFDLFQPNDYAKQEHIGLEYAFQEFFSLRAGYKANYDNDGMTFGGGVKTVLSGLGLAVDYSYGTMGGYLAIVHRISLGVTVP